MENEPQHRQVSTPPEEDGRRPVLDAMIERLWQQWRPKYV